jgi:Rps23 Pro-64 3,4-dihydroxylase Tpa1-like proline 4-hydroxylase
MVTADLGGGEPVGTPHDHGVVQQEVIAQLILQRIDEEADRLAAEFEETHRQGCGITALDNLLPQDVRDEVCAGLPRKDAMVRRRSLGERKYCLAETNLMTPALRNCIAAFASATVADRVTSLLGMDPLSPDPHLYNGGVTMMAPGDFMRPHLDNSHNLDRRRKRRIVALYYCSDQWEAGNGGALSIWSRSPLAPIKVVEFRPNRFVLMEVSDSAWHSVDPVFGTADRINLTTYFYDAQESSLPVRLTRFMGWPGEPVAQAMLEGQFQLRMLAQRLGAGKIARNAHIDNS